MRSIRIGTTEYAPVAQRMRARDYESWDVSSILAGGTKNMHMWVSG